METGVFAPLYINSNPPTQGGLLPSVTVAATNASATASTRIPGDTQTKQIQISNTTNQWAYVNFGNLSLAAVTAATVAVSYPVSPGATIVVTVGTEVNGASVILAAAAGGSTAVIFTRGEGI